MLSIGSLLTNLEKYAGVGGTVPRNFGTPRSRWLGDGLMNLVAAVRRLRERRLWMPSALFVQLLDSFVEVTHHYRRFLTASSCLQTNHRHDILIGRVNPINKNILFCMAKLCNGRIWNAKSRAAEGPNTHCCRFDACVISFKPLCLCRSDETH